MRIAVLSDIHGNRTAFEAVLTHLRQVSPDLILHGGDLSDGGSSPGEIADWIRDLGWPGVIGNGEEALARPQTLDAFAAQSSAPAILWGAVREVMSETRARLGSERIRWLGALPGIYIHDRFAVVHASPEDLWRSPGPEASDAELAAAYEPLGRSIAIYGHIHRPFIRTVATTSGRLTVANCGSVGLPYDGDRRASYLLLDEFRPTIKRVEYNVEAEIEALLASRLPHSDWLARTLHSGCPQMP